MKITHLFALGLLASSTMACAAQTESELGAKDQEITGGPTSPDGPRAACTPIAEDRSSAMVANPAATYCTALGYALAGEDCVFPDATQCEQWAFYRGECGAEHSFCNQNGGSVANETKDMGGWTASYAVCTLASGQSCSESDFMHACSCEAPNDDEVPACTPLAAFNAGANPSTAYCVGLGYAANDEQCTFPDGTSCGQWEFYRGECGGAHSFCNTHGGTVANKTEDMGGWTASYAECTLPTGAICQDSAYAQSCSCE